MASIKGDDGSSGIPVPPPGTYGVWGDAKSSFGVVGTSGGRVGVYGESNMTPGDPPEPVCGVEGRSANGAGVRGEGAYGVDGRGRVIGVYGFGRTGVLGEGDPGVFGRSRYGYGVSGSGGNIGVYAVNSISGKQAYLATPARAGHFYGNVTIQNGVLEYLGARFVIDHPLDPANKYLSHSSVASADQKNLYDGVATLDDKGEAVVELPGWFSALNGDFRYQLTCIGGYAPVFVARKIEQNRFVIAGGSPGLEVSWQVTGIRQDAWAKANPLTVEEEKPEQERGTFREPELHGHGEDRSQRQALYPKAALEEDT